MESAVQVSKGEVWTEEKHVHFLNTMEASFVRTMLHHYHHHHHHHHLRLDRHLPDTSESTLDSKPQPNRTPKNKKHAPSDSMGSRARRTRRRSSQRQNSSQEQVVPQLENGREGDACVVGDDDKEQRSNA